MFIWKRNFTMKLKKMAQYGYGQKFICPKVARIAGFVCFLLGKSLVSEVNMPTFRNTLSGPSSQAGRRV
jgi:hypothetical protein